MGYELGVSRRRKQQERRRRVVLFIVYVALLGAIGAYGYFEGQDEAGRQVEAIYAQVSALEKENEELRQQTEEAVSQHGAALLEARTWRSRYEKDLPTGARLELLELLTQRLEDGVSPARLTEVLKLAEEKRNCDADPSAKRFVVSTPIYDAGPAGAVAFDDGAVVIAATGEPAKNEAGQPEGWFDPREAVTVTFTWRGGDATTVNGVLPLHHAQVVGNREFRFSITSSRRAFASVSLETCAYP
ncbi:hypothetical protein [Oceanibacterium hippocampi]|uniref:Uncharacterized protein n=1 Tax=Oceanibacterium hippocampi TaxID=745714 RepID=A0A1Y5RWM3_9PROT|nr:hypothetical protein [Oceanibacterium hippocampi]SLN26764.1 hypothetical protein OCH7691_00849 [Oceanibacterium hippocampi]